MFRVSHTISNLYASLLFFLSFIYTHTLSLSSLSHTYTHTHIHTHTWVWRGTLLSTSPNKCIFLNMPMEQGALNSLSFLYNVWKKMWNGNSVFSFVPSFIAHKTITAQQQKCRRNKTQEKWKYKQNVKNCLSDFVGVYLS